MPVYRSITLTLHSQFDILPLPEYALPPASPINTTEDANTPHVLTPSLPGSHFWLSYAIAPPVPTSQFFLFKMRIDGNNVVSWCAGGEEGCQGKVVCGLFEGKYGVGFERRAFRFAIDEGEGGCVEIDVHRASGRRRVPRRVEKWNENKNKDRGGGIELVPAGRAGPELPKRFYKLALIDPVDRPFAQFRFYYRSWEQLEDTGVLYTDADRQVGEENALPVIEPSESAAENHGRDQKIIEEDVRCTTPSTNSQNSASISNHDEQPAGYASLDTRAGNHTPDHHSISSTPLLSSARASYQLPIPPRRTFSSAHSNTRALPGIPRKNDSVSSIGYHPHPAYRIEEWNKRTPSPIQSAREGLTTPQLRKKGFLGTLKGWKRNFRGVSTREKRNYEVRGRNMS